MRARKRMDRTGWVSGSLVVIAAVALCAGARLLPHPPNVTPVAAMALFAGASMSNVRRAFAIPLAAMIISDLIIGMHALAPLVYACILGNVVIGRWLHSSVSAGRVVAATFAGSVLFFLATNFGCWVQHYELSLAGLVRCYVNAIPFFGNTAAGDMMFSGIAFGVWALQRQTIRHLQNAYLPVRISSEQSRC